MLLEQSNSPQIAWHSNTPHTRIDTHTHTYFSYLPNMTVALWAHWGLQEEGMGGEPSAQWCSGISNMAVCSPCPLIKLKERNGARRPTEIAKQTNLVIIFIFPPAAPPLTASMFSPLSPLNARFHLSPLLLSLWVIGMKGSHSLCVVISIDLSTVQQPFPADFLSFALPPLLTLYPLIVPPPPPIHLSSSFSTVKF